MTPPSSQRAQSSWHGDPDRDFVIYRLIELAREFLDDYLSDDENVAEYQAWLRRIRRRKQKAATDKYRVLLRRQNDGGGTLSLIAQPGEMRFSVITEDKGFRAEVAFTYDVEIGNLVDATVAQFDGNTRAALVIASSWLDALGDSDFEQGLEHFLHSQIASRLPAPSSERPTAPSDATTEDAIEVEQLAQVVAAGLARDGHIALDDIGKAYLEATPQSLWPILEGLVTAFKDVADRDENLVAAYQWLLANQLELIRYRSERGWKWADEMLNDYQERIAKIAKTDNLSEHDWFSLVTALNNAKVPVNPMVREALTHVDPTQVHEQPSPAALSAELRHLIDELGKEVDDPFAAIEGLTEVFTLMPAEFRAFLTHELALSPYPVLRDTVPLMLLDGEAVVRRAAAAVLEQTAAPETLSPVSLRRTIIVRNWIPEEDRAGIDRVIRKSRTKGVICAQWITPPDLTVLASPIDGSGAQSLILTTKAGKVGFLGGLLLKQNFGIRDSWCYRETPRREINRAVAEVRGEAAALEVERQYLDLLVQHHIAIGLSNGHLPAPTVLDLADSVGGAEWRDRKIDIEAEIGRMFSELDSAERAQLEISASLKRSGQWVRQEPLASSWFEDDANVRALVAEMSDQDPDGAVRAILNDPLEKRRAIWAERFLLLAWWARATKFKKQSRYWRDFLILARELSAGRPLAEIPVMAVIAERTVSAALADVPF